MSIDSVSDSVGALVGDALSKATHITKSPEVLDDWLKSSATVLNKYYVTTNGINPLGKDPKGNMRG